MKKLFIICLLCLSMGATLKAQYSETDQRGNFTFGFKVGLNYSNVWDEQGQDFTAEAKAGFAGGLFFGIPITEYFGFQPELLISQKGFQGAGTLLGYPYSFARTTTYLDIPLQFQVKLAEFLTLVAGPEYSYLLSEKNVYTYGANSTVQEQEFNNDNIRDNIFGLTFGGDVNIQHIVLSARLGWDLQTNNGDGTSDTPRYKNQWVQFTLGFKL